MKIDTLKNSKCTHLNKEMKQTIKGINEDQLQAQCITWFRAQYKKYYWNLIAIPNGGKRNVVTAVRLKRTGVLSGAWDLFLSVPKNGWCGMFIEMKVGKNKMTGNQVSFYDENVGNYHFKVCRTLDQFQIAVNEYLKL